MSEPKDPREVVTLAGAMPLEEGLAALQRWRAEERVRIWNEAVNAALAAISAISLATADRRRIESTLGGLLARPEHGAVRIGQTYRELDPRVSSAASYFTVERIEGDRVVVRRAWNERTRHILLRRLADPRLYRLLAAEEP